MTKFLPKKGEQYWMINSRFIIVQATHSGGARSSARIANGNAFRTNNAAEIAVLMLKDRELDLEKLGMAIETSVIEGKIEVLELLQQFHGGTADARRLITSQLLDLRKELKSIGNIMNGKGL